VALIFNGLFCLYIIHILGFIYIDLSFIYNNFSLSGNKLFSMVFFNLEIIEFILNAYVVTFILQVILNEFISSHTLTLGKLILTSANL